MINKVILVGNLGRDPEVRHLEGGISVAKFPLATNENFRDRNTGEWRKDTEWHNIVAWRFLAERAEKQLHKGSLVYIEGKITTRKWQDKDGNDRYSTEVVANTIRSLERRDEASQSRSYGSDFPSSDESTISPASSFKEGTKSTVSSNDSSELDDDLPF